MTTAAAMQPVCITTTALAEQLGTRRDKLMVYARRADDPLPVRYLSGKKRYGFVVVAELMDWLERNSEVRSDW
ncbi:hypothetical protein [Adlercreutzia shanghongiae]|uniref:Helix-turn-helix domain-containing protein n=1 Tax=Adlercreutzia shanghongiae TaxID=3111773 RepID=A0ABU6IW08_9ACTN|nr:hypothetical protein [Adlercreutzia sp. R22]MEC4294015.1 hypothetical protein [Adlercreutzia sp. R22]